jgi:hypothetical protein
MFLGGLPTSDALHRRIGQKLKSGVELFLTEQSPAQVCRNWVMKNSDARGHPRGRAMLS